MEDAKAPSLLAAVRILAREGTLDARLTAFAHEARTVSGGVGAVHLLRDVDGGAFATPAGEPAELEAAALGQLREASEERRASWSVALPSGLAELVGASMGSLVPLMTADGTGPLVLGVLVVGGGDVSDDGVRDALRALSDLAAVAVEQERLRAALQERVAWQERLARTDPLTGLADLATFLQMLELEVVRATRQGTPLAVVLFAVDDLQHISTAQGGRVADDILRVVAATLADGLRLVDTIARLGPDEVGVVAPGMPAAWWRVGCWMRSRRSRTWAASPPRSREPGWPITRRTAPMPRSCSRLRRMRSPRRVPAPRASSWGCGPSPGPLPRPRPETRRGADQAGRRLDGARAGSNRQGPPADLAVHLVHRPEVERVAATTIGTDSLELDVTIAVGASQGAGEPGAVVPDLDLHVRPTVGCRPRR
ncbi:MAG: GGDEF domain-containing protein [Chloroflexota bacterium]